MISQKLLRFMPAILVVFALAALIIAGQMAWSRSAQAHYKECAALAANEPLQAIEAVKLWRNKTPASPLARHCDALALYSLKRYADAAKELHILANEAASEQSALWGSLVLQAEEAYYAAGKLNDAILLLTNALAKPEVSGDQKAQFLAERGKLYYLLHKLDLALQDWKDSLVLKPNQTDIARLVSDNTQKFPKPRQ